MAKEVLSNWSKGDPRFDQDEFDEKWVRAVNGDCENRVTMGTVMRLARDNGYTGPRLAYKTGEDLMTLERAQEMAVKIVALVQDDVAVAFSSEALEAAAALGKEDQAGYARLMAAIEKSEVNAHDWRKAVTQFVRSRATYAQQIELANDNRAKIYFRQEALHHVVDDACAALAELGGVFDHNGELVSVVCYEAYGQALLKMHVIKGAGMQDVLARAARFLIKVPREVNGKSVLVDKDILPPRLVADALLGRGTCGLPVLSGFVDGACMLETGEILCQDGYHGETGVYVRYGVDINVPDKPSQTDAKEAYLVLTELVSDFEFKEPRDAQVAAWIATILTIIARRAIQGSTPLFLYEANRPRIGKTRLADIAVIIATGRSASMQVLPGGRNGDEELGKVITSLAREGASIAFFDNVKTRIGGPAFEMAITSGLVKGRILGESKTMAGELKMTWIATSNSASLTPDMVGRTLPIGLSTESEAPESRAGFKHPDIIQHVRDHRKTYLCAALTILRARHVANASNTTLPTWGSFEQWSMLIRNSIVFAGGVDPYNAREALREADKEMQALSALLHGWPLNAVLTTAHLEGLRDNADDEFGSVLRETIPATSAAMIGKHLAIYKGRVVDGKRLANFHDPSNRRSMWHVETVGQASATVPDAAMVPDAGPFQDFM